MAQDSGNAAAAPVVAWKEVGVSMKNRLIVAAVFVPLLVIIIFFLPEYIFTVAVAVICVISTYEFLHATGHRGRERISIYSAFSAALIPVGVYFDVSALVFPAVLLIMLCLLFVEAMKSFGKKKQLTFSQIAMILFGSVIIPYLLSSLIGLRKQPEGRLLVLLPMISAFVTDAGAYFSGLMFGKKPAFPLISPKKTVEGYAGGLVTGTAAVLLYGAVIILTTMHDVSFGALVLCGVVGAVVTELGDLAFSLIKREFEIKDYGRLLPGHGGILDRFDSMVFAAPVIWLLVSVIPVLTVL